MGKKKMKDNNASLLDSDTEDSGSEVQEDRLSINKKFAKEFERQKQKQELENARLDDGSEDDEDDEEESSEDEDGELLTKKLDTNIFKTLNALKNKDKEIYDPGTKFFKEENEEDYDEDTESPKREKKEKRKTYKDLVRDQILEEMNEEEGKKIDPEEKEVAKRAQLAYDEEQREIRKAFLQSTGGQSDDKDEDDLMVLKPKNKGNEEDGDDEEFLEEIEKLEKKLKAGGEESDMVDPKGEVKDGAKFLLNFFKNRSWIDQHDAESSESSDEDEDEQVAMKPDNVNESADDSGSDESLEQLEKNDDFEARYNFRFEAAEVSGSRSGADFSNVGYARGQTMDTLRRKDDSRAKKRQARKERKEAERRAKEEQLKRLKNAKRVEMQSKLQEIKKVLGEVGEGDAAVDEAAILKMMEGDYDPEKLDKLMAETFGDEFYEKDDAKWKSDQDVRKELEQDEEGLVADGGLYDDEAADDGDGQEEHDNDGEEEAWVEEEEFNDEEYYEEDDNEKPESELEKKIKSKMAEELYKLDYEDIIAGMPTRFKYRQVEPNNYGLTTEEILFARDTSLQQYVSLKKMAPYRDDGEYAVARNKRRAFREMLEHELEEVVQAEPEGEAGEDEETNRDESGEGAEKKKKKRRRSKKRTGTVEGGQEEDAGEDDAEKAKEIPAGSKVEEGETETNMEDSESAPKKKRRRRKKSDSKDHNKEKHVSVPKDPASVSGKNDSSSKATVHHMDGGRKKEALPPSPSPTKADILSKFADKAKKVERSLEKKFKSHKPKTSDKKKKTKKDKIEGITASRLNSYGF